MSTQLQHEVVHGHLLDLEDQVDSDLPEPDRASIDIGQKFDLLYEFAVRQMLPSFIRNIHIPYFKVKN